MRELPALIAVCFLAAGALWSAGFARFSLDAQQAGLPPPAADGIVVLTGGANRIETALRLLAEGKAPALLISGVGRASEFGALLKSAQFDPAPLDTDVSARVTIGHEATTTLGNAAETEHWARRHAIRRLIVVTAGYHMPRALLEIADRLPDVTLYPVPVQPPALRGAWDVGTLRLLSGEYDKLLAVRFGLHHLWGKAPAA